MLPKRLQVLVFVLAVVPAALYLVIVRDQASPPREPAQRVSEYAGSPESKATIPGAIERLPNAVSQPASARQENLGEAIQALLARSTAAANVEAFNELEKCAKLAEKIRQHINILVTSDNRDWHEAKEREFNATKVSCATVSNALILARFEVLEKAIRAGYPGAATLFINAGPNRLLKYPATKSTRWWPDTLSA
jgi:hypothetical protein